VAGTAGAVAHRQSEKYAAQDAAQAPPVEAAPAAPAEPEQPAYMAELEHLNELKTQGIVSEEEFEAKKKLILGV
jgi:hypothetical protein